MGGMDKSFSSLPMWFRRLGLGAWLVVGMVLVLVGAVWLLGKTASIVDPLIAGFVIGAVAGVFVDRLERHGWSRAAGAAVLTLGLVALGVLVVGLVLAGISSQAGHIDASMSHAVDKREELGPETSGSPRRRMPPRRSRRRFQPSAAPCCRGVIHGISGLTSLVVFLGFTAFSAFFLLKDAPALGRWIERHMGMRPAEARVVMSDIIQALRRYFLGLTIIAGLSTAGVVLGARDRRGAAAGDDRDRHLHRQLRADPRCVDGRHLRVRARAGRSGHDCRRDHGDHRVRLERAAAADRAAGRLRRDPSPQPARGVQRHDRRRRPCSGSPAWFSPRRSSPPRSESTAISVELGTRRPVISPPPLPQPAAGLSHERAGLIRPARLARRLG